MLNSVFEKCWNTVEPPLTETMYHDSYYHSPYDDSTVAYEEVLYSLEILDVNRANGPDGISAYMLKATAESISHSLARLFSISLSTGKFPTSWKLASIVPIPKSTNKSNPNDYRPISLLSIVSKLLERYVYKYGII